MAADKVSVIRIPNGVTEIGWEAFCGCTNLVSVRIPDSVREIGREAFADCPNLTDVKVPRHTILGEDVFRLSKEP